MENAGKVVETAMGDIAKRIFAGLAILIALIILAVCFANFLKNTKGIISETPEEISKDISLYEVGGCQYVVYNDGSVGAGIVHHKNCQFCKERK